MLLGLLAVRVGGGGRGSGSGRGDGGGGVGGRRSRLGVGAPLFPVWNVGQLTHGCVARGRGRGLGKLGGKFGGKQPPGAGP